MTAGCEIKAAWNGLRLFHNPAALEPMIEAAPLSDKSHRTRSYLNGK